MDRRARSHPGAGLRARRAQRPWPPCRRRRLRVRAGGRRRRRRRARAATPIRPALLLGLPARSRRPARRGRDRLALSAARARRRRRAHARICGIDSVNPRSSSLRAGETAIARVHRLLGARRPASTLRCSRRRRAARACSSAPAARRRPDAAALRRTSTPSTSRASLDPHAPRIDGDRALRSRRLRHEGRPRRGAHRLPRGRRSRAGRRRRRRGGRRRGAREHRRARGSARRARLRRLSSPSPPSSRSSSLTRASCGPRSRSTGRAAHGSRPHLGVDAIVKAGPVLTALARSTSRSSSSTHPLLARGSVHASPIGAAPSCRASRRAACSASSAARSPARPPPTSSPSSRPSSTPAAPPTRARRPRSARCSCASRSSRRRRRVVPAVARGRRGVLPAAPAIAGASFWADSAFIAAACVPTVLFGPSGEGAHALEEWVSSPTPWPSRAS